MLLIKSTVNLPLNQSLKVSFFLDFITNLERSLLMNLSLISCGLKTNSLQLGFSTSLRQFNRNLEMEILNSDYTSTMGICKKPAAIEYFKIKIK